MRHFSPKFKLATLAGEQNRLLSKIGGLPWGFPETHWPVCCGQPQRLLAQLRHDPPMLDLGAPGAVLHLFQCLECGGIDDEGRDVVLLHESDLGRGLVKIADHDKEPELGNSQIGELWIDGWEEKNDDIPGARLPEFFDENSYWRLQTEYPSIAWFDCREKTKFGGSPRWTGNGPSFEPRPFEFFFQLDNYLFLAGPPPGPNQVGGGVTTYKQTSTGSSDQIHVRPDPGHTRPNAPWTLMYERGSDDYYVDFTNLGSDGTIYVFIDRNQRPHEVKWLWSR